MSKARLVITAVVIEGRKPAEVAAAYGVSRSWLYELLARYRAEGEAAFEPRSRRPHTSPGSVTEPTIELIWTLRRQLVAAGLDAGPDTIAWHLTQHHGVTVSRATIARLLAKAGLVTPEPKKKPKSSYVRFEAAMPNETWQSDFTHYRLSGGTDIEILSWLDDCTRMAVRLAGIGRQGGKNAFENELRRLHITQKNGKPNHPTTQGKVCDDFVLVLHRAGLTQAKV